MISIFNSTTDYKGDVTTNCEEIRKMMEFPVQITSSLRQRRFGGRRRPRTSGSSRLSAFSRLLEAAAILLRTCVRDPVWFSAA